MASAALSRPQGNVFPLAEARRERAVRANDLCDQLLIHMLDCDLCLDPAQPACPVCINMQSDIQAQGGPGAGVLFAV